MLDKEAAAICMTKGRGKANAQNKQNKAEKAANRKKLQEEKTRLMEEKRRKKEVSLLILFPKFKNCADKKLMRDSSQTRRRSCVKKL